MDVGDQIRLFIGAMYALLALIAIAAIYVAG